MGNVNINLSHSDVDKETSNFMDNIYSNSFFTTINFLPTRIATSSKTSIDIFYNDICKKITTILLPPYLIAKSQKKKKTHLTLRFFLKTVRELLNKKKPWVTGRLINSINKKNSIYI